MSPSEFERSLASCSTWDDACALYGKAQKATLQRWALPLLPGARYRAPYHLAMLSYELTDLRDSFLRWSEKTGA